MLTSEASTGCNLFSCASRILEGIREFHILMSALISVTDSIHEVSGNHYNRI